MNTTARLFAAALIVATTAVSSQAVLVTFDELDATTTPAPGENQATHPGALTQLQGTPGGIGVTLTRENNDRFDIIDNAQQGNTKAPLEADNGKWGARSVDFFFSTANKAIITFDTAVHTVSMLLGDYGFNSSGALDDDAVLINAYASTDATGSPLANTSGDLLHTETVPGGNFTEERYTVFTGSSNIRSIEIFAGPGGDPPSLLSVFLDRLFISNSPEPIGTDGENILFDVPDTQAEIDFMLDFLDVDNPEVTGVQFGEIPEPSAFFAVLAGFAALCTRR